MKLHVIKYVFLTLLQKIWKNRLLVEHLLNSDDSLQPFTKNWTLMGHVAPCKMTFLSMHVVCRSCANLIFGEDFT